MDQDKGTSEQVVIGRTLSLDRGSALTLLRRLSTDRSVMLDLRRLYGEEVNRTALHLLKDDAVLVQLAERIARGDLTISSFRPVERPGPTEGEEGESSAAAATVVTEEKKPTATISNPRWSVARVAVGSEVKAAFTYSGFVDDKAVTVTFFEKNADGSRKKLGEKQVQVSAESGEHECSWKRDPDSAKADLEEDKAEGDTGPLEYVFTAESKKAGSTGDSGPLWLTNTVTVELKDEAGKAVDKPQIVVLTDHEKELRVKSAGGKAKFEKVIVGPIQLRLAKPSFSSLEWSKPKIPVGKESEGVFKYEDALKGMKVSVFVHEFDADGTSSEIKRFEDLELKAAKGEMKFTFTRTEEEAAEDLKEDASAGDQGPLEYRYLVVPEIGKASDASQPLHLTHKVVITMEDEVSEEALDDGMEVVMIAADGMEYRGALEGGTVTFEDVVCGPMRVSLAEP